MSIYVAQRAAVSNYRLTFIWTTWADTTQHTAIWIWTGAHVKFRSSAVHTCFWCIVLLSCVALLPSNSFWQAVSGLEARTHCLKYICFFECANQYVWWMSLTHTHAVTPAHCVSVPALPRAWCVNFSAGGGSMTCLWPGWIIQYVNVCVRSPLKSRRGSFPEHNVGEELRAAADLLQAGRRHGGVHWTLPIKLTDW